MANIFIFIMLASFCIIKAEDARLSVGEYALLGQFPYVVAISRSGFLYFCGGTIITTKHIITYAWCADYLDIRDATIKAGCIDMTSQNCTDYQIENAWFDPTWHWSTPINAIAVVSVVDEFIFNELVQPIAMSTEYMQPNTRIIVTGWDPQLRWFEVTSITSEECDNYWHWSAMAGDITTRYCTIPGRIVIWGDYGCPNVVNGQFVGFSMLMHEKASMHQRLYPSLYWINEVINSESTTIEEVFDKSIF